MIFVRRVPAEGHTPSSQGFVLNAGPTRGTDANEGNLPQRRRAGLVVFLAGIDAPAVKSKLPWFGMRKKVAGAVR